jgi:dihydrofolate reductase
MEGGTTFHFVTDGVESAIEQARAAAGEKDVQISGGASVIQQALAAGLLDDIQVSLAPRLLGGGTPLFGPGAERDFELDRVVDAPGVTHLRYRVRR